MDRVIGDYALKSAPKDGSIEAALDAYTKEKLLKLAAENGIIVQRKWKKAKLVEVLSEGLMDSLEGSVLDFTKEDFDFTSVHGGREVRFGWIRF